MRKHISSRTFRYREVVKFERQRTIYSFIFPLTRVARAALVEREIPHGQQQAQIIMLALHQNCTKQSRRCNHAAWSLVDIRSAFPLVQPAERFWPIFRLPLLVTWPNHHSRDAFIWRRNGSMFRVLRFSQLVEKCHTAKSL